LALRNSEQLVRAPASLLAFLPLAFVVVVGGGGTVAALTSLVTI
jgi:hypothetical protein